MIAIIQDNGTDFTIYYDGLEHARGEDAEKLAREAFEKGAFEVHHRYDLKVQEERQFLRWSKR